MKVPNFKDKDNNVVNIGHNSNRSISQEAYQQLKDKIKSVVRLLSEADKKHRASHGDNYYFPEELTNPKDVERYPGSPVEYGKERRANPYEKQSFARDTETLIDKSTMELRTAIYDVEKDVEGNDE